jgi:nucleoside-diphosphate-sugar epimerase
VRALITGGAGFIVRKAERVAGYRPRVSLDETLKRVIEHLRDTGRG